MFIKNMRNKFLSTSKTTTTTVIKSNNHDNNYRNVLVPIANGGIFTIASVHSN